MKSLKSLSSDIDGKVFIVRLDLNVPLNNNGISDTTRIDKIIPTLRFLLKKKNQNNHCLTYRKT